MTDGLNYLMFWDKDCIKHICKTEGSNQQLPLYHLTIHIVICQKVHHQRLLESRSNICCKNLVISLKIFYRIQATRIGLFSPQNYKMSTFNYNQCRNTLITVTHISSTILFQLLSLNFKWLLKETQQKGWVIDLVSHRYWYSKSREYKYRRHVCSLLLRYKITNISF